MPLFSLFQPLLPLLSVVLMLPRNRGRTEERKPTSPTHQQDHPKKRGTQQDQPPRWCRSAPDAVSLSGTEANKDRGDKGQGKPSTNKTSIAGATRERKDNRTSQQERESRSNQASQQRKGHPPHRQGAGSPSPHHKFAPKNQQKVAWGSFEKIFGKIFRGNVSGEEKPLALSQRKGVLFNK